MTNQKLFNEIFSKAANYCSKSEKCNFDIFQYLKKQDYNQEIIEAVVEKLNSENYINESRYSAAFVNDKFQFSGWGKIKIAYMLGQKQIPSSIINSSLDLIDQQEYEGQLHKILKAKIKSIKTDDKSILKEKLLRFASSRGFEIENIYKIFDILGI